jgi:predicted  nucleic acid-binding Zn-ribbon protein
MDEGHNLGRQMTEAETRYHAMDGKEAKSSKKQKKYQIEMDDLLEYVKWCTLEHTQLRKRLITAEKIINSLRKRGEESIDKTVKSLMALKTKLEDLENEAEGLRTTIRSQEDNIEKKETLCGQLRASINSENEEHTVTRY